MLIHRHDEGSDVESRLLLASHDFGQLIAPGADRDVPVVVPTHFIFDGDDRIAFHLARPNPVWAAIEENPTVLFTVVADWTYVDTKMNANPGTDPDYGVPTSYYASVQAKCRAEILDDHDATANVLMHQLRHFQPEGGHAVVSPGDNPYGKMLRAIRGIVLHVEELRGKFKYGGNKSAEHRDSIETALRERGGPGDVVAAEHLRRRSSYDRPS